MNSKSNKRLSSIAAWTLSELMVAMALSSLLCGGLIAGSISLQKSFVASRYHILAQAAQMRLTDYMDLDLRRALSVSFPPGGQLSMTIPDYYDSVGKPRDPQIKSGGVIYGPTKRTITYYKDGATIYRTEGASTIALASDVSDLKFTPNDMGQSIQVSVTFVPKYRFSKPSTAIEDKLREGTAIYSTILLRNKRQS